MRSVRRGTTRILLYASKFEQMRHHSLRIRRRSLIPQKPPQRNYSVTNGDPWKDAEDEEHAK
jgi:hypothetical protein